MTQTSIVFKHTEFSANHLAVLQFYTDWKLKSQIQLSQIEPHEKIYRSLIWVTQC